MLLKGIVHPEMKIHSLSTHPYADGELVVSLQNTSGVSGVKCCIQHN